MANATFHTGCPRHPKILVLSDAAFRLWFNAILYCHEHLTDGLLLKAVVPSLKARVTASVLSELTTAAPGSSEGLWVERGIFYEVHDYLHWNDSKAEVQRGRALLRERVKRARAKRTGDDVTELPAELHGDSVTPIKPLGTPISDQRPPNNDHLDRFARFWNAYPKKTAKPDAEKAFVALKVSESLLEIMLAAIALQRQSRQWQDKQYIPHPATWLRKHRWDDEVEADSTVARATGPAYDTSQQLSVVCQHEPRCTSWEWHRVVEQREGVA